jgi:hypothetical protein
MLRGGGCSITLLGDVKDFGPRNNDFIFRCGGRSYFGHGDRSVDKRAVHKDLFILFSHGRIQIPFFLRFFRSQQGGGITYEQSAVYGGEYGWQVHAPAIVRVSTVCASIVFNRTISYFSKIFLDCWFLQWKIWDLLCLFYQTGSN